MSLRVIDLKREIVKSGILRLADVDQLASTLSSFTRISGPPPLVVIDFEGLSVYNKPRIVTQILSTFTDEQYRFDIAFVNLSSEAVIQFARDNYAQARLVHQGRTLLLLSQVGDAIWLGAPNSPQDQAALTAILNGEQVPKVSPALESLLRSHPDLFVDKGHAWYGAENLLLLMKRLDSDFEIHFKATLTHYRIEKHLHVKLPSGSHSTRIFEMGLLVNHPEAIERLAREIVRRYKSTAFNLVLCSSLAGIAVGREIRHLLPHVECIPAYGYPAPFPRFPNNIAQDTRILALSDAMSSGQASTNLRAFGLSRGSVVVASVVLLDATGISKSLRFDALAHFSIPTTPAGSKCRLCASSKTLYEIDVFTSLVINAPSHRSSPAGLLNPDEFWSLVLENDALLEGHWHFNGHHFSIFIQTSKILSNPSSAKFLAEKLMSQHTTPFGFILCPAHDSAMLFARVLSDASRNRFDDQPAPIVVPVVKNEAGYAIPPVYARDLPGQRILVVDDGANYGDTLIGIHFALEDVGVGDCVYAVFVDRLIGLARRKVERILGTAQLISLFHLEFPPYRPWDCPSCSERRALDVRRRASVGPALRHFWDQRRHQLQLQFVDECDPAVSAIAPSTSPQR
jgi:orotate phosphoribosyltransferase